MAPDGLVYVGSWIEANFDRCFQLMEADDPSLFDEWFAAYVEDRRRDRDVLHHARQITEPQVDELDADDPRLVRDVVKAKGDPGVKQAYQLVEEFMIAANEAVGSFFRKRNAATVWRVHAPPAQTTARAATTPCCWPTTPTR